MDLPFTAADEQEEVMKNMENLPHCKTNTLGMLARIA
jgi:hypothetical protein